MSFNRIGIIGAMTEEIELLHEHVKLAAKTVKAGITYYEGTLHGLDVIYCKSGVGKVNAAVCTQILLDYGADCVIFTGVAGAVDPALNIGDIVISTSCAQHDMDCTALGYARGSIPYHPTSEFQADERLVELASSAGERLFPGHHLKGKVLSGDQFIADRDLVKQLHGDMQGTCTEMEGASVAQVCVMNDIPFVIIRSMSDKADGSAHVNFGEFTILASKNSFLMVDDIIRNL